MDLVPAWVPCDHMGCQAGLALDARHLRNFAGRAWYCPEHAEESS